MAKVIRFPTKYRGQRDGADVELIRYQSLVGLRMVLDDIRSGRIDPTRLLVVYDNAAIGGLTYLNLGYTVDGLAATVDSVLKDIARDAAEAEVEFLDCTIDKLLGPQDD